jgi:hypothetical protein
MIALGANRHALGRHFPGGFASADLRKFALTEAGAGTQSVNLIAVCLPCPGGTVRSGIRASRLRCRLYTIVEPLAAE